MGGFWGGALDLLPPSRWRTPLPNTSPAVGVRCIVAQRPCLLPSRCDLLHFRSWLGCCTSGRSSMMVDGDLAAVRARGWRRDHPEEEGTIPPRSLPLKHRCRREKCCRIREVRLITDAKLMACGRNAVRNEKRLRTADGIKPPSGICPRYVGRNVEDFQSTNPIDERDILFQSTLDSSQEASKSDPGIVGLAQARRVGQGSGLGV